MHEGTGGKSAHCTHHVTFGKDDNIFSNYKQFFAKKYRKQQKKQNINFFNIVIKI